MRPNSSSTIPSQSGPDASKVIPWATYIYFIQMVEAYDRRKYEEGLNESLK